MTTPENVLYASTARPWLKYYAQKYIDQTLPTCSAFDYVCQQNKNRLGEAALNYYGRKFTYADFIPGCGLRGLHTISVGDGCFSKGTRCILNGLDMCLCLWIRLECC